MSFNVLYTYESRTLILGTWPSPKSRAQNFYYGHPQNRFWPLLAELFGEPAPADIPAKKALICNHGLALWDTIESCTITGASDASIRDVVPNDIAALCEKLPIRRILCNGATAYKLCVKYNRFSEDVEVLCMPSTSPANAAWSMERLKAEWAKGLLQ